MAFNSSIDEMLLFPLLYSKPLNTVYSENFWLCGFVDPQKHNLLLEILSCSCTFCETNV